MDRKLTELPLRCCRNFRRLSDLGSPRTIRVPLIAVAKAAPGRDPGLKPIRNRGFSTKGSGGDDATDQLGSARRAVGTLRNGGGGHARREREAGNGAAGQV